MSCEYCKKRKSRYIVEAPSMMDDESGVDARVAGDVLIVSGFYDSWGTGAVGIEPQEAKINFCPMCGRKL